MNILHVASFSGNIGDEANHNGFYRNFKRYIDKDINVNQVEIREFYKSWGLRKFDNSFVEQCNQYDLLVIGGGNFFELCWEYSQTGTTIDIGLEELSQIKVPIFINGIGVDDTKGYSTETLSRFRRFLCVLLEREKTIITVRNDGSFGILKKYFSDLPLNKIKIVPDGGFFLKVNEDIGLQLNNKREYIGVNIAGDMLKTRFGDDNTYKNFIEEMASQFNKILESNNNRTLVLFPHIYADLLPIQELLKNIKDVYRRNNIIVAPLLNGSCKGGEYIFSFYKKCDFILAMRFHANICAIAQNIPHIGLITLDKHKSLFEELGLEDRMIMITKGQVKQSFGTELFAKIESSLNEKEVIKFKYRQICDEMDEYIQDIYLPIRNIINY